MKKVTERNLISGRIDSIGRLLLPTSQMKSLDLFETESAELDFNHEGIIISKSLGYSIVYDRIKITPIGIIIGRDICRSKGLMAKNRLSGDYYKIRYYISDKQIIIPLTEKQKDKSLRVIRSVDELGRILIPNYLRVIYNLNTEVGVGIEGDKVILSNDIKRKTIIDGLGRVAIPKDLLKLFKVKLNTELEVESGVNIYLSHINKP